MFCWDWMAIFIHFFARSRVHFQCFILDASSIAHTRKKWEENVRVSAYLRLLLPVLYIYTYILCIIFDMAERALNDTMDGINGKQKWINVHRILNMLPKLFWFCIVFDSSFLACIVSDYVMHSIYGLFWHFPFSHTCLSSNGMYECFCSSLSLSSFFLYRQMRLAFVLIIVIVNDVVPLLLFFDVFFCVVPAGRKLSSRLGAVNFKIFFSPLYL